MAFLINFTIMRVLVALAIFFSLMGSAKTLAQDLGTYQWKNRIILLKDANLESDWLQAQLKRLGSNPQELLDRDLVLFLLTDELVCNTSKEPVDLKAETIITYYELDGFEGLVLIGKDGGLKLKEEFIVSPTKIFELIDGMPMRISEMKNKG